MVAVLAGALLIGACAQDAAMDERPASAVMSGADDAASDIFYASQEEADADLMRFDRKNPQCQLWTNWQKVCTRVDGVMTCRPDPVRQVRPSKVFCGEQGDDSLSAVELLSSLRFCDNVIESGSSRLVDGEVVRSIRLACDKFDRERPFNGRDFQALRSKQCIEWSDRATGELICREGSGGSCDSVGHVEMGAFCSKKAQLTCEYLDFATTDRLSRVDVGDDGIVMSVQGPSVPDVINGVGVHALRCK